MNLNSVQWERSRGGPQTARPQNPRLKIGDFAAPTKGNGVRPRRNAHLRIPSICDKLRERSSGWLFRSARRFLFGCSRKCRLSVEISFGEWVFHKQFFGNGGNMPCQEGESVKLSILSTDGCGKTEDIPVNYAAESGENPSKQRELDRNEGKFEGIMSRFGEKVISIFHM